MSHNHHHTHHEEHCHEHEEHCCGHHHEHHDHHEHHHGHHHDHGGHEHHHHESSPKKQIAIIVASALLLAGAFIVERSCSLATWQLLLVYLVPYLLVGYGTLKEAVEGIIHGEVFNEHFLMSIATIGALAIGFMPGAETEYPEAVFVMLFFQVGELFEGYAEGKSRESISHLMDIRPDTATVLHAGVEETVSPETVSVGETIIVRPGEKVPMDAVIIEGSTALNTVALTGESVPREVSVGDEIISGCVNISGVVKARVTKSFGESTVSKIIDLVENASEHKSRSENFISRFARIYTPIVVFAAILLALVPPLFYCAANNFQFSFFNSQFTTWFYRALMFLVVSCPCALVISVPLSFYGGIGGASRKGILVKGANYMDVLAKVNTVVFDKTGTLTQGRFAVEAVHPERYDEQHLLHLAAHVEHYSTHPIGAALRAAFREGTSSSGERRADGVHTFSDGCQVSEVTEVAGQGMSATINPYDTTSETMRVTVGNAKMMESIGVEWHECELTGTIIHIAINGEYAGHIVINDQIKEDSAEAISELKELGVGRTVMLTGDGETVARDVATRLDIDEYHARLLPSDKVEWMEKIRNSRNDIQNPKVAFVGDGINDAPVLALADVGIAMGGMGSDAAIEAADVVLMDDKPSKVAIAIGIARRTLRIAKQNVVIAIGIKVAVLMLAAFGIATMWMAVFADVGVTVLAVLNAIRTLKTK